MKLEYFLKLLEQNRKLSLTLSSNFPPNFGDSVFSKARVKYQFFFREITASQKRTMDSTLNEGLAGIRALRDEYDENCIKVIKAKTRVESLEKVIADKESETSQLNKNIENLDDQIVLLESQLAAMDVTIDHYRQVKRYYISSPNHFLRNSKKLLF